MLEMFYHKQQKKNTSRLVTAGVVGAVVGAVGTAATIALSDENTRYKVSNTLNEWKDKSWAKMQEYKEQYGSNLGMQNSLEAGKKSNGRAAKITKV